MGESTTDRLSSGPHATELRTCRRSGLVHWAWLINYLLPDGHPPLDFPAPQDETSEARPDGGGSGGKGEDADAAAVRRRAHEDAPTPLIGGFAAPTPLVSSGASSSKSTEASFGRTPMRKTPMRTPRIG